MKREKKKRARFKRGILLNETEIVEVLKKLPGWQLLDGKLHREYRFAYFVDAFAFMTAAALTAESMNHYPEWLNMNQLVVVKLFSQDLKGISSIDVLLAQKIDHLAHYSTAALV